MSAPKRSPLAAKVLEIEDGLIPPMRSYHVTIEAKDWDELVRLASAVELVDAEEAATKRALVEALGQIADSLESLTFSMRLPVPAELHLEGMRASIPPLIRQIREALAGVKHG